MNDVMVHFAVGPNAVSNLHNLDYLKKYFDPDYIVENWPTYGNADLAGYLSYIHSSEATKGNEVKTILIMTFLPESSIRPRLAGLKDDIKYDFHLIEDVMAKRDA